MNGLSYDSGLELARKRYSTWAMDDDDGASSRLEALHAYAASQLGAELITTFSHGRGLPGGWMLLNGPVLNLGSESVVPALAGWRKARLPRLPRAPGVSLTPDWVCEVFSLSTPHRASRLSRYASEGVVNLWLVDPERRMLEVLRLDGHRYVLVSSHAGHATVRAEPFEALDLRLSLLWAE
jgi:hypothetical protein